MDNSIKICKRCKNIVFNEKDEELKKTYPYYCKTCDENLFDFETIDLIELMKIMKVTEKVYE